jgi:hypothetical protein
MLEDGKGRKETTRGEKKGSEKRKKKQRRKNKYKDITK